MPTEIIDGIGDAIGSIFENPAVQAFMFWAGIYIVVIWIAAAYWAFRDMQSRTENPIVPYLASAFIILFTPIFFPLAVFVYRIVRPQERIGEIQERELAEEALLAEVDAIRSCPTCHRRTHDDWIICPTCRTRLQRVCPNCSRLVELDWSLCAWCGRDFERREIPVAVALPARTDDPEPPERLAPPETTVRKRPSTRPAARSMARPIRPAAPPARDPLTEP
jgi:RNA polymerase subunit RPABC4/transcription elongation factor Spt4